MTEPSPHRTSPLDRLLRAGALLMFGIGIAIAGGGGPFAAFHPAPQTAQSSTQSLPLPEHLHRELGDLWHGSTLWAAALSAHTPADAAPDPRRIFATYAQYLMLRDHDLLALLDASKPLAAQTQDTLARALPNTCPPAPDHAALQAQAQFTAIWLRALRAEARHRGLSHRA